MDSINKAARTQTMKTFATDATSDKQGPAQLVMGLKPTAKVTATEIKALAGDVAIRCPLTTP